MSTDRPAEAEQIRWVDPAFEFGEADEDGGIALVPPESVRPGVHALSTDPRISRELVLVHAATRPPSPAAAAFLAGLQSVVDTKPAR